MARTRLPKLAPKTRKPKQETSAPPKQRSSKADARIPCTCSVCDCRCHMSVQAHAAGAIGCWLCSQGIHTTRAPMPAGRQPEDPF